MVARPESSWSDRRSDRRDMFGQGGKMAIAYCCDYGIVVDINNDLKRLLRDSPDESSVAKL